MKTGMSKGFPQFWEKDYFIPGGGGKKKPAKGGEKSTFCVPKKKVPCSEAAMSPKKGGARMMQWLSKSLFQRGKKRNVRAMTSEGGEGEGKTMRKSSLKKKSWGKKVPSGKESYLSASRGKGKKSNSTKRLKRPLKERKFSYF